MDILLTGLAAHSPYVPFVAQLADRGHTLHVFSEELPTWQPHQEGATLWDGSPRDVRQLERAFAKTSLLFHFLEKTDRKGKPLTLLLDEVRLLLDVAIAQGQKRVVIVSDGCKAILAHQQAKHDEDWRPTEQHSNWERLQYLVEQEVFRARAEHIEAFLVWHAPLTTIHADTTLLPAETPNAYALHLLDTDLFAALAQLGSTDAAALLPAYLLTAPPVPVRHTPEKVVRSFWDTLLFFRKKTSEKPWHLLNTAEDAFPDFANLMQKSPAAHKVNTAGR